MTTDKRNRKVFFLFCCLAVLLSGAAFPGCGKAASVKSLPKKSWNGEIELPGAVTMKMVKVEAGTFEMSAADGENYRNEVAHQVTLKHDFYIGRTEVTQAQWEAVMGDNPSEFKGAELPVENMSWNDAMEFCEKLNSTGRAPDGWKFTLPTETQWEYAARGGKHTKGYKYSGSDDIDEVAWYMENPPSGFGGLSFVKKPTHQVGQKKANELGLYDMSGNVWEWCLDDYQDGGDSGKLTAEFARGNDRNGPNRAIRGGSSSYRAYGCRVSCRGDFAPDRTDADQGVRVVLVPESL